ncbi:MAG TPA: hypothetical protein VLJ61_13890 [Pyrinomonadaceae bacterium]|nr:hypothetical protein [Pyrinomonadaceae bacterium]
MTRKECTAGRKPAAGVCRDPADAICGHANPSREAADGLRACAFDVRAGGAMSVRPRQSIAGAQVASVAAQAAGASPPPIA